MTLLAIAAVLIGCSGTTPTTEPVVPPQPTAQEQLRGSWIITVPWIDRGEERGSELHVLTFTEDRWIQYRTRRDLNDSVVISWSRSGTWSIADSVVTRTWIDLDNGSLRSVGKDFRIEGDTLHVDRWTSHVPVDDLWTYTRLPPLTVADLYGTWRHIETRDDDPDVPDEDIQVVYDLRIGEECSYRREWLDDEGETSFIDAIGACDLDLEELRVTFVVDRVATSPGSTWGVVLGKPLTFAIAPYAKDGTNAAILVSGFWREQVFNPETSTWEFGNDAYPYGLYDLLLEKVSRTPDPVEPEPGVKWRQIPEGADLPYLESVIWNGERFMAVGEWSFQSTDGETWTRSSNGGGFVAVAWNGARFVAVGGGGKVAHSVDGDRWTRVDGSGTSEVLEDIVWGNGLFVAVGENGTIVHSPDGYAWTVASDSATNRSLDGVAWNGIRFVAVGLRNTIVHSTDGDRWTAASDTGTDDWFLDITWSGTRFVAVGAFGIWYSDDGDRWTRANVSGFDNTKENLVGVAWSGTRFVAVGSAGTILHSLDDDSWVASDAVTTERLSGVAWSGSRFVAVGRTVVVSP